MVDFADFGSLKALLVKAQQDLALMQNAIELLNARVTALEGHGDPGVAGTFQGGTEEPAK